MHYFTFADKDTTIYEVSSSMNTGLDEVLEVRKDISNTGDLINVSRILIKFDLSYLSESISRGLIPQPSNGHYASSSYYLNLYDANPTSLATSQSLFAYPVSQSWTMGDGHSYDNPISKEGASWTYRIGKINGTLWAAQGPSASGGQWYSGSEYEASFSFDQDTSDVRMNVTDIFSKWLDSTIGNDGFMIKRSGSVSNQNSGSDEGSTTKFGNFSFFSSDTHTKYPPTLEVMWDDSKWSTGSLSPITGSDLEDMAMYMKGLRPEYKDKSKAKFRVVGRGRFPAKTYSTTPSNLSVKYLPSGSSYYSIKDAETNETVVPYGSGSKLSCDSSGNYFNVWMNGYQPERYYKLEYRVISGSGTADETDQYFDEGFTFKVSL